MREVLVRGTRAQTGALGLEEAGSLRERGEARGVGAFADPDLRS